MSMTVKGTLIQVLKEESGISKSGKEWIKQEFVIETKEQYPKKICFSLMNDKLSLLNGYSEGSEIEVSFNLESRGFNGKWYHSINAWKIEGEKTEKLPTYESNPSVLPPTEHAWTDGQKEPEEDSLPF